MLERKDREPRGEVAIGAADPPCAGPLPPRRRPCPAVAKKSVGSDGGGSEEAAQAEVEVAAEVGKQAVEIGAREP